jgi:hypothetical protein
MNSNTEGKMLLIDVASPWSWRKWGKVICFLLSFVSVMDNTVRLDGLFCGPCKGSILLESVMFSVLALIWDVRLCLVLGCKVLDVILGVIWVVVWGIWILIKK